MRHVINGNETFFIEAGKREASAVVLIHGMCFDHQMWVGQIKALSRRFHVIAYDVRGHGKSGIGDGQYTYRMFIDDLIALLDHFGIDRAVLCGLSMGGAIALRAVESHPDRVSALILCDTHSAPDSNKAKYWREEAIATVKQGDMQTFVQDFMHKVFAPGTLVSKPEIVETIRSTVLNVTPLAACGILLAQAARTDTTLSLSGISVPTLLLVGEEDSLTPPSIMRSMQEKIPHSQLRIISGAGHASNLENPEQFNEYLMEFLENISF